MEGTETGLRGQSSKVWPQISRLASKAMAELRTLGKNSFLVTKKLRYPVSKVLNMEIKSFSETKRKIISPWKYVQWSLVRQIHDKRFGG